MTTALDIITSAMRKIGAITKNETPSADEANDALETLNDMLGSWSNDSIIIPARTLENFTLAGASASKTIGSGGDFNTVRPVDIIKAYVRSGTIDYDLLEKTDEEFADIPVKSTTGTPQFYNYDNAYPLGTLKFYPVPDQTYTLFILSEKPLASFSSLNAVVDLPPGTNRAIINNLAVDLSPEYGVPVSAELDRAASTSRAAIAKAILRNRTMDVMDGRGTAGNIYTGWFY